VLTDTGTLGGTNDARDATLDFGIVPSVLSGEILHAVTIGWPDQVASETSLANLQMAVGGTGISAGFVMAKDVGSPGWIVDGDLDHRQPVGQRYTGRGHPSVLHDHFGVSNIANEDVVACPMLKQSLVTGL